MICIDIVYNGVYNESTNKLYFKGGISDEEKLFKDIYPHVSVCNGGICF